jgi:hypothetical protein
MMKTKPSRKPPSHLTPFGIWLWLRVPIWAHWYSFFGMEGEFGLFSRNGYCFLGLRFDAYTTYWPHMENFISRIPHGKLYLFKSPWPHSDPKARLIRLFGFKPYCRFIILDFTYFGGKWHLTLLGHRLKKRD